MAKGILMDEQGFESADAVGDGDAGERDDDGAQDAEAVAEKKGRGPGRPFARGQSGNPDGRPPRRPGTGRPDDPLTGADQPTRAAILEEAYRQVTVRDGDTDVEMTAHRAMLRSLTEAALKGGTIAKRRWVALVLQAEAEQMRSQIALFNVMERPYGGDDHKANYEDGIVFDRRTGGAVIRRPADEGE